MKIYIHGWISLTLLSFISGVCRSVGTVWDMAEERWFKFELRRIKDTNGKVRAAFALTLISFTLASVSLLTDSWQYGMSTSTVQWSNVNNFTVRDNNEFFDKSPVRSGLWRICCLDEGNRPRGLGHWSNLWSFIDGWRLYAGAGSYIFPHSLEIRWYTWLGLPKTGMWLNICRNLNLAAYRPILPTPHIH